MGNKDAIDTAIGKAQQVIAKYYQGLLSPEQIDRAMLDIWMKASAEVREKVVVRSDTNG